MAHIRAHSAISATATSSAISIAPRLVPGNRVKLRIVAGSGTYTSNNKWVITVTVLAATVDGGGSADSTYKTSLMPEHTITLGDGGANGAGTFFADFPAQANFKIVATKTGSPGTLTVDVLTPSVPA